MLYRNHSLYFKKVKSKRRNIIFFLVFIVFSCSVNDATLKKDYTEIDIYSYYIKRNQNNPNADNYFRRSQAYIKMERFIEAIDDINMAIKINPTKAEYFDTLGMLNYLQGKLHEAIINYSEAIRLDPKNANYYCNRGSIYSLLDNQQKALDDCNIALKIDQDFSRAYSNRGAVYYKMEKYQNALNDLNVAILLSPKMFVAYNTRGCVYYKIMQYDNAIDDFNQAIQLNHNYSNAYVGLGTVYFSLGEYKQAEVYFTYAINIKNDYTAFYKRGMVYLANGRYNEALKDINNAISIYNLSNVHEGVTIDEILETKNIVLEKLGNA